MRSWFPCLAPVLSLVLACSHSSRGPTDAGSVDAGESVAATPAAPGAGAGTPVTVSVSEGLRAAPFDVPRTLTLPAGFSISVFARVPGARFLAVAPDGDVLVSQPGKGTVKRVHPRPGQDPEVSDWATGLRLPHDLVFHTRGGTTWVYVSEAHQVTRSVWTPGEARRQEAPVLVSGLPDSSLPELQGRYGHELKNLAVDSQGRLYVAIASTCNVCLSDTQSTPQRATVYRYGPEGGEGTLFARGLRNAEGLAFAPGGDTLWVTVNGRDNTPYPLDDGSGRYGRVIPEYVDNHPPEAFTQVREGGHYGWPFCNPNPDSPSGLERMPLDRDWSMNRDGSVDCEKMDRIDQGIQAHSAPLGLAFLTGTAFPLPGVAIAYHGSWNRTRPTGYKVTRFAWDGAAGRPTGGEQDFVSGWVEADGQHVWGRPVDVAVTREGALLISDDQAVALYLLRKS